MLASVQNISEIETVYIDNENLQTYRGRLGLWTRIAASQRLEDSGRPFGTSAEEIREINELPKSTYRVARTQYLFVPFSEAYVAKLQRQSGLRLTWEVPKGEFIWPVEGRKITSRVGKRWGRLHPGIDIATASGTIVLAAMDGEVIENRYMGAYGNLIIIDHGDHFTSRYAHLSEILVKKGDKVKKGQIIALSGNTGRSTGPHLHFEVRYMDMILNPEFFLPEFVQSIYAIGEDENGEGVGGPLEEPLDLEEH